MLNVAICEDCGIQAEVISELMSVYLKQNLEMEWKITNFSSGDELLKIIDSGIDFDLLLLDILMPGLNGMELAKQIKKRDENVKIIFLTVSKSYAVEAFRIFADYYLVKPVKRKEFYPVLDKVISTIKSIKEGYIKFPMPECETSIPYSAIVCMELVARRARIHLENGLVLTSKCLRQSFDDFIAPLLNDKRFIHTHKSYAINLTYAITFNNKSFTMRNNLNVPVTKKKYAEAKERFYSYRYEQG